jgi:[ribosomal protein S5]-alanine N-acetyltransferase
MYYTGKDEIHLIEIMTDRLLLIPCSLDLAKSLILFRRELEERSPIDIPGNWPSDLLLGFLPLYIEKLERDQTEFGWGIWLVIDLIEKRIIGDILVEGKPDPSGLVRLCCNISDNNRDYSLAYEGLEAMIEWMMNQKDVKKIMTECGVEHEQQIKLYDKLGMRCIMNDGSFLQWEIVHE